VQQIPVSIPDELAVRMRSVITSGNRNRIISAILEKEIRKREQALYEAAVAVENDDAINAEMSDWEVAVDDGIID
jgi:metal-responsive CopG/Arc/MetJ family transcriptional regulator